MSKSKKTTLDVQGAPITILAQGDIDYISLTDMLKAKDGDFFISDWLRNRNTVEFLGIWESVYNPDFNYGGFATIKAQAVSDGQPVFLQKYQRCLPDRESLRRELELTLREAGESGE